MAEYKLFPNIGYLQDRLKEEDLLPVLSEIKEIKNNFLTADKFNSNLAGNIEKEFSLKKSKKTLEKIVLPLIKKYDLDSNILSRFNIMSKSLPVYLDTTWVNFQKKYEFNPTHSHEGLISFVIWIDIPIDLDLELHQGFGKNSNSNCPGFFEFLYSSTIGEIATLRIPVDKTMENTIILFPSKMIHCVYPFSQTEDYRISVSGNFKLLVE